MTPKEQVLAAADIFDGDYRRGFLQGALHSPLLELAVEALKAIGDIQSAFKQAPGRVESYRDYELREIARKALAAIEEARK